MASRKSTLFDEFVSIPEKGRLFEQERLMLEVTQDILAVMSKADVRKAALAERLGKSKPYVTRLLDGRTNMTLRTMSDIFYALGQRLEITYIPLSASSVFETPDECLLSGQDASNL